LYWLRIEFEGMLCRGCNELPSFIIRKYFFMSSITRDQQMFPHLMTQTIILFIRYSFKTETASIHVVVTVKQKRQSCPCNRPWRPIGL
jgi:hypothetical protein